MSNLEVTAIDIEDWARDQVVLRCLQRRTKPDRAHPRGIRRTTILGWSIHKTGGNRAELCEARYEFISPSEKPPKGLAVKQLGSNTIVWFDHFTEMISDWREHNPGWLIAEPNVAVRRGSTAEKKVPFRSIGVFEHYCHFLTRLAYKIKERPGASAALILMHSRLEAINEGIVEGWDDLLDQMHV